MACNDVNEVVSVCGMTVKEVAAMLNALPAEQQDWLFSCCGCADFWMHQRGSEKVIIFDTQEFID